MKYQIIDGTAAPGGETVLSHIDFEIQGAQKVAVVGRNGAGKTTLLRLIAGELELERDDRRQGPGICCSRTLTIGMLHQQALLHEERTVEEYLMSRCPSDGLFDRERFEYEREYDCLFTGLGFKKEDKKRPLNTFSGGERTKAALAGLLLEKPDILLLDEPTNHLDMESITALNNGLIKFPGVILFTSHDHQFVQTTANRIMEILPNGKLVDKITTYDEYLASDEMAKKRHVFQVNEEDAQDN